MNHVGLEPPDIDADYVLWMEHQITLIRERQFAQLDLETLLGELEYIVNKRKCALKSRLLVLMMHLLKYEYQAALRSRSWLRSICTQRRKIEDELADSPSLRGLVEEAIAVQYPRAVRQAAKETGLAQASFPPLPPYSERDLFDFDFFP